MVMQEAFMAINFLPQVLTSALENAGILERKSEVQQQEDSTHTTSGASTVQNENVAVTALKTALGFGLFALSGFGLFGPGCALITDESDALPGLNPSKDDCEVLDHSAASLEGAVSMYNRNEEEGRQCLSNIRVVNGGLIVLPNGLTITQTPKAGSERGTTISGANAGDENVVLDLTGFQPDAGDCPVKVYSGAKVEFRNLTVHVKNPDKAICTGKGVPIPNGDPSNPFAFLNNVKIVGADTK